MTFLKPLRVKADSPIEGEQAIDQILTDWLAAVRDFHRSYYQLLDVVSTTLGPSGLPRENPLYLGQCPTRQLTTLVHRMKNELISLTRDLASPANDSKPMTCCQLSRHTHVLVGLHQQAQTRLYLATLSVG